MSRDVVLIVNRVKSVEADVVEMWRSDMDDLSVSLVPLPVVDALVRG